MRYSDRSVSARLAPAQTRGSVLPELRFELSGGNKVLRPLRQTDSLLSEFQLSFNLFIFRLSFVSFHFSFLKTHVTLTLRKNDKWKTTNGKWKMTPALTANPRSDE